MEENLNIPKIEYGAILIPDSAKITPVKLGNLILCGYKISEDCRKLSERKIIYAETYWTLDEKITEDYLIQFIAIPERECIMPEFSQDISQGDDDPKFFTSDWEVEEIYKITFALEMPPLEKIANADLNLELRVIYDEKIQGVYRDSQKIEMHFSHTPYYRLEFPDSIYQNKVGQTWTAKQLEEITGGKWITPPPKDFFIRSIIRSRKDIKISKSPILYVSIKNAHRYLHNFADKVAAAIVSTPIKDLPKDFPQLLVKDSVSAMFDLGFASRARFQGKVIGVTGSNGKSTTVSMIKSILSKNNIIVGTLGNRNSTVSIAQQFAAFPQNKAYAVMELSSVSLDIEWGSITYGLKPHVAVVTSITDAHLLEHETMEGVARAKSKIFCGMSPGNYAVLNRDMPYYEIFEKKAEDALLNIITFGKHPKSAIRMRKISDGEIFTYNGVNFKLDCPVPQDQIYDALAAVGVSIALAVPIRVALRKLKNYKMLSGRDNLLQTTYYEKNMRVIDGSYNATFLSIKTGLEYLNSVEKNSESRVIVLGDIAHLGDGAEKVHRQLADVILQNKYDRIFLCGEYMKILYEDIKNKCNCYWFESGQKLIPELKNYLRDGDCVFIKGSIPAKLKLVVDELLGSDEK